MPGRLLIVAGYAASGKTRVGQDLARRLPACYLDKDTLAGPFVERLLEALGQPASDRDSAVYRNSVRSLEYEALVATGLEAASLGADVLLSAPFLAQLADATWTAELAAKAEAIRVALAVVWIACDRETLRARMTHRGSPRDVAKLAEWDDYSAQVDEQLETTFTVPSWRFNNGAGGDYDAEFAKLVDWLRSSS